MKLIPLKFGFAFGLWWGVGMLTLAWGAWLFNWGTVLVKVIASVYIGFSASFLGGIIGLFWGFVDFFIFTYLVAWTYNCCVSCCNKNK